MKKVILILVTLASIASAGMYENTTVAYGSVSGKAKIAGYSATDHTSVLSLRQDLGYAWSNVRASGYLQIDKYEDDMISDTEGNANSFGVEVDYIKEFNNGLGFFIGGLYGKGTKDLGSDGDSMGVSDADFIDMAFRTGVTYSKDSWEYELGVENKKRDYDDMSAGGNTLTYEEEIQSFFVSAAYSF